MKVWVVTFDNEYGFYTFSSAEKAYKFLYKNIETTGYDIDILNSIRDELTEDYEEYGASGYTFGAEGYGNAEATILDEED